MAVKDFVQQTEQPRCSSQSTSRIPTRQAELLESNGPARVGQVSEVPLNESVLPPRPARFITPALSVVDNLDDPRVSFSSNRTEVSTATFSSNVTLLPTIQSVTSKTIRTNKLFDPCKNATQSTDILRTNLSPLGESCSSNRKGETTAIIKHIYPPDDSKLNKDAATMEDSHISMKPVPALSVFSRNAYPLWLPKLDHHIALLSAPYLDDGVDSRLDGMFPPMDDLAKTGRSIDDLETNSTVAPAWRNRTSIIGGSTNFLIGFLVRTMFVGQPTVDVKTRSSSFLVPMGGMDVEDKWRKLFLGTIPNILALNFAPVVIQSLLFFVAFMAIGAVLLYYFHLSTCQCDRYTSIEGLQQTETKRNQWGILIVTFLLTVLYLPLSTMSLHVLVWSEELWAIPNPYLNLTTYPPIVAPLGPSTEFRDPLDFCWTTTMKRNEVNFAPIAVVLSAVVFLFFGLWFPIALRRVISRSVPKLDQFTELGRPRSSVDLDGEYHRLLNRDRNPFAFLYNGFRRGWGTYISTYLFAKLSTLAIIAIIDPDNCLFRTLSRSKVSVIRQSLLLVSTLSFFIAQCVFAPFLDPVNNASEWTSRLNYLSTSATALAITLNIPGKDIIDSYVLYCIYVITYGLGFYFSLINFNWMQRVVKRLTRRIDFSVDIFSPRYFHPISEFTDKYLTPNSRLDISSSSIHTKRRIWQESITTLLLTDPKCKIPKEQAMAFAQARDSEFPPYLLDFMDTPGERHVENLKILREVGSIAYNRAVSLTTGPDYAWYRRLEDEIQKNYVGPDSYWKRSDRSSNPDCKSHFGNAWWIPFPPTLVIRYDDGPYTVLNDACDLEAYITQNSSRDIQRRRFVRMSLRALEGRVIQWPYEDVQPVGSYSTWWRTRSYRAVTSTRYEHAILQINRRGHLLWKGLQLGSGFSVKLKYSKTVTVSSDILGLTEDFDLTPTLARFLQINRELIDEGLFEIEETLSHYRLYHRQECQRKRRIMTYRFLTFVYDHPRDPDGLIASLCEIEGDRRIQDLMVKSEPAFRAAYTRLEAVRSSELSTWWYIFWDDLWRRNHDTISSLEKYASDFNPYYKTSIAYTPLPRAALENFLTQRGMLHKRPRWGDYFHAGFLNKLYLRLNDTVFRDSDQAIMFHIGNDKRELDMEDVDIITQGPSSTLGTGGGTDHNDSWIRTRPTYRWEGLLSDPPYEAHPFSYKWMAKLGAWMGITPLWRSGPRSRGLYLDLKLENGRYVLLDDHQGRSAFTN
ncbi:hypothetical protein JR316_0001041 [Psilocybe cubensis]|uniref:Uncharacterized protein n=1 Tax=Psilocybe cubensis TaxID=181762 RepID=A0ACB8HGZ6_PSICU|nr:hypothetical protein JR316_0001041 [Psilocybe cubensis]KAH9486975.1 hypothetical protein JR316_0001041 [Psilocybe cubensis]